MIVWTHRGNPGPENTLEAFSEAYKNGIRYFETDLHATKDGHLFLMHDNNLIRVCGTDIDPETLTLEELGKFLIEDIFKIPTLDELHKLFPDVYFSLDMKSDRACEKLIMWAQGKDLARVVVGSFDSRRVQRFRHKYPKIRTALTQKEILIMKILPWIFKTNASLPQFAMVPSKIGPVRLVTQTFIANCHKRSIKVFVWVVNNINEKNYLHSIGVDGIITDDYSRFIPENLPHDLKS